MLFAKMQIPVERIVGNQLYLCLLLSYRGSNISHYLLYYKKNHSTGKNSVRKLQTSQNSITALHTKQYSR